MLTQWASNPTVELSNPGKNWLVAALDPFHDTPMRLDGWPDVSVAPSVCRTVKQTLNISATGGTVAPWDLHVAQFPTTDAFGLQVASNRGNNVFAANFATPSYSPIGGVMAIQTTPGAACSWTLPIGDPSIRAAITVPVAYTQGSSRVISQAFELRDTTAAIYRQGSLTAWRQAQGRELSAYHVIDTTIATGTNHLDFTGVAIRFPPSTSAQAMLYPGSFTHKAEEGIYSISTFNSDDNPPYSSSYSIPVYHNCDQDDRSGPSTVNGNLAFYPNPPGRIGHVYNVGATAVNESQYFCPPCKIIPINTHGCILAGLNPQSTYELTTISVIESFPSISEDVLTLATPSSQFDGMALKLYSHAMMGMPVALPVGENATGDWFFDIINKVGRFLAPVLSAVPHPMAKSMGEVARVAGESAGNMMTPNGTKNLSYTTGKAVKRKKLGKKNANLNNGSRGKKGKTQGPLRK